MSWCGEAYQPYTAAALLHLMSCKTHKGVFFTPDGSFKFQRCERQGHAFDCFRNHKGLFFGPYGCVNFPRCERQGHAFDCFRNRKTVFWDPMGASNSHDVNVFSMFSKSQFPRCGRVCSSMLSIIFKTARAFFHTFTLWQPVIPTMWTPRTCFRLLSKSQGLFFRIARTLRSSKSFATTFYVYEIVF